jgi:hypothetical protein
LPAQVYQAAIDGEDDDFAHLHVVVIEIDANQRLCIPAYDAAKPKVTSLCEALHKQGIYEGIGWIELDNAKVITFRNPSQWTGKIARWVTYKPRRIERRNLRKLVGEISDLGLAAIVEALLRLQAARPHATLARDELKKVKTLARQLGVKLPTLP